MWEKLSESIQNIDLESFLMEYGIPWTTNIVLAIVIFVVGRIVAKILVRVAKKALGRAKLDEMLIEFIASILTWILLLLVLVISLEQLGVDTTSFIAVLGAAGLAIGLALKDSLGNFAAGVMLIIFRPFRTGDFVKAGGAEGVVEEIRIFSTKMRTLDNQELTVPNAEIYSGVITNVTARDTRRIDLVFGIGYDDDLRLAKSLIEGIVGDDERILEDPAPVIVVGELGDSSVNIWVRPWTKTEDYFATKCDLLERMKLAFDDAGVSIPFPQMDVHLPDSEKASA